MLMQQINKNFCVSIKLIIQYFFLLKRSNGLSSEKYNKRSNAVHGRPTSFCKQEYTISLARPIGIWLLCTSARSVFSNTTNYANVGKTNNFKFNLHKSHQAQNLNLLMTCPLVPHLLPIKTNAVTILTSHSQDKRPSVLAAYNDDSHLLCGTMWRLTSPQGWWNKNSWAAYNPSPWIQVLQWKK